MDNPPAASPPAFKLSWADQAELADPTDFCPECYYPDAPLGWDDTGSHLRGTGPLCFGHSLMDSMLDKDDNIIPPSERSDSMLNQWAWQDMQDVAAAAASAISPPQPSKRRTRRSRARRGGQ